MRKMLIGLLLVASGPALAADPCTWDQRNPRDQVGATRTQTPEKVLEAIQLVRTGETFRLGHVYDQALLALPFGRVFELQVFPFSFPDEEDNSQAFNEGVLNASIGQVGTQFDALGHSGHDLGFYNCFLQSELGPNESGELEKLGVENVRPFFTRAVLLDFVSQSGPSVPKMRVMGQRMVEDSYVITLADVQEVLDNEGIEPPGEGDVAIVYTGWDGLFGVDNDRHFNSPGVGIEVANWLANQKIAMLGSDTQQSEAAIGGLSTELADDPDALGAELGFMFGAVHFILLAQNGIHLMEWMRLGDLAEAISQDFELASNDDPSPYEFLFVYSPLPIKGLPGAPASPLAVR